MEPLDYNLELIGAFSPELYEIFKKHAFNENLSKQCVEILAIASRTSRILRLVEDSDIEPVQKSELITQMDNIPRVLRDGLTSVLSVPDQEPRVECMRTSTVLMGLFHYVKGLSEYVSVVFRGRVN